MTNNLVEMTRRYNQSELTKTNTPHETQRKVGPRPPRRPPRPLWPFSRLCVFQCAQALAQEVREVLALTAKVSNLRITLALPQAADNTFQLKTDTVKFVFDATQRAAEAR